MKQKKYSKVLLITIVLMLSMVFLLNKSNKESYKVNDISGNKKALDDVSIVYTPSISIFNNRTMVLNKENLKTYENPSYIVERNYIDIEKSNRKFLQSTIDENIYENDKNVGTLSVFTDYEEYIATNYIKIKNKNLSNGKIKNIKIDLPKKYNNLYLTSVFTFILDNDVYTLLESYENHTVYIIKINLKTKKLTELNKFKSVENSDDYLNFNSESIKFYNDNKIYLEFYYQNKREYTNFLIYDINTNTFVKSNEFMNKITSKGRYLSQNRFDYQLKDNKLNVLIGDSKGNISKLVYNIKDNNIVFNEEVKYNLNLGYTQEDINFSKGKVKLIDDKIYSIYQPKTNLRSDYSEHFNYMMLEGVKPAKLTVFDTLSNKKIYEAELFNGNSNLIDNLYLVKNY